MNILVCPDKFKGSLTARQVCDIVGGAIKEVFPDAAVQTTPLADGGEGTCSLLTEWHDGSQVHANVHGPLFDPIRAAYGISGDDSTAFIEMAAASGLTLLESHQRDPRFTTSLGTGELITHALDRGVKKVVLGIGGSATNDAGIGMATALGYSFLDAGGHPLKPTGENLTFIRSIRTDGLHTGLRAADFICLCDVTNPLFGPQGAAYVYGPQKGADQPSLALLDEGLRNFHEVVMREFGIRSNFPGAGAAGGLGAGAHVFLNASIEKGINYIIDSTDLVASIQEADLIITGEGRIDDQTFSGKVVSEVARLSTEAGKPVIAFCGGCELSPAELRAHGISNAISLVDPDTPVSIAMKETASLLHKRVIQYFTQGF